ncbi:hypothetical protein J2T12_005162 [Paenibacillus anaericanus]|uniref:Uncharacterized protein n=1 Tax=Paenibacillus anaericanus TaxID=170367 RepID=A0A3S1DJI0_9BACL|nr:hypothetical protein [Paenibacillus anaericanus]MDQ0091722.1 hypothetical protein [Paenibacillus anaericanus]RUT42635.1 hypothetical protein EJP82_22230 [Paenibacillus anaericanus]
MPEDTVTNATFYQYRLLKKLLFPKALIMSYLTIPFIWLAAEMLFISWTSIFFFILSIPVALWIQYVISRSVLIVVSQVNRKRWKFSLHLPWIGYMPDQFISYAVFRRVHYHSAWMGFCIIAILIPWSPVSFTFSLFFWYLWLMTPRLFALIGLRDQPKDGMLKFNEQDLSYYKQ